MGCDALEISKYITPTECKKLHKQKVNVFANLSIRNKTIEVPLFIECFKLKKTIYDLLEKTHTEIKNELKQMRKNGDILEEKNQNTQKTMNILNFDFNVEKELLIKYDNTKISAVSHHFCLIELQNFYYKYRDIDEKYLNLCIKYCIEDLQSLEKLQEDYIKEEKEAIDNIKNSDILDDDEDLDELDYSQITPFNGDITAFKRLSIIYEKQKSFDKASEVCRHAIDYYTSIDMKNHINDFQNRLEKINKKMIKNNK